MSQEPEEAEIGDVMAEIEDRSVIDIRTGRPWIQVDPDAPPEPDQVSIDILRAALEMAESGDLVGVILVGWDKRRDEFRLNITLPPDEKLTNSSLRYIGVLEIMREELLDLGDMEGTAGEVITSEPE